MAGKAIKKCTLYTRFRLDAVLVVLVILVVMRHLGIVAVALFQSDNAVHIDPGNIESSTLIIGTHLIYLHALNEEIYAIAMDSAASSGQDRIYYKSELAGEMWIDITDAGSIKDITAAGDIADVSVIENLYFTHHTKSDRITYDLRTNAKVCIFDIYNVYDLENMPELEALKIQYDMMRESGSSTKSVKRNLELVKNFFAMQVTSDTTVQCDIQLQALQGYYDELVANGADSKDSGIVLKVMEKIDNSRKAAVFAMVDNGLLSLQDAVLNGSGDEDTAPDDALLTAIGNSQYALSGSMTEAQGNMLAKGDTVISETEYTFSNEMISNAQGSNYFGCDEQNQKLQSLENISNGIIVDRNEEVTLLDGMIDAADVKYGQKLSGGVTQDYRALVLANVSHAALQSRKKEDMSDANAVRAELEFFIQGKVDRQEKEEAQNYILLRIQDAAKFKVVIKQDDYSAEYQNSVLAYVDWLNSLLDTVKNNGSSQNGEESIYEQKAALQEQKLEALDALDLDTAKKIDAKIADIDEKIDSSEGDSAQQLMELLQKKAELERELESKTKSELDPESQSENDIADSALQAQISRLEVEIAECRIGIPDNSQAANILKNKNEILGLLAEGDGSDSAAALLESDVSFLTSMLADGSAFAKEALKEVYQKLLAKLELEDVGDYQELQDKIEAAISDSVVNTSLSGEMSVQGVQNVIADVLGMESLTDEQGNLLPDISDEDFAAALIALGEFNKKTDGLSKTDKTGEAAKNDENSEEEEQSGVGQNREDSTQASSPLQAFTEGIAAMLSQGGDGMVFQSKKQGEESYVPAETLAAYLGYRYVWNDTGKSVILSRGRHFLQFMAFRDSVENEKGEIIYMDSPAAYSGGIYLPGSFVENYFACRICDISGTNYSVLVNDKVVEKSQEILSGLLEKGGF